MNYQDKIDFYNASVDKVANALLDQIKAGAKKCEMPWHKGIPLAQNAYTARFYGGNNLLILWNKCLKNGYSTNRWATLPQWRKRKAKVRRGEHGTLICIAIPKKVIRSRRSAIPKLFDVSQFEKIERNNIYFRFSFKYVFNQDQVSGCFDDQPGLFDPVFDPDGLIRKLISTSKAVIEHGGEKAIYMYNKDKIIMPEMARFFDSENFSAKEKYHSVLTHELMHWTGHHTRCNRKLAMPGLKGYAFEELVAELGNAILSTQLNYKLYPREIHSNYLSSWLRVLSNDFSYLTEALELARYAIYWLFRKTGMFEDYLKNQHERQMSEERVKLWQELDEKNI
jgi:antirestriction protein ArdC